MGRHVLSGGFASKVLRDGGRTQPVDQKTEFSTQEPLMTVFVTWDPKERLKTLITLRIFDQDNRILAETKPVKTTLRASGACRSPHGSSRCHQPLASIASTS